MRSLIVLIGTLSACVGDHRVATFDDVATLDPTLPSTPSTQVALLTNRGDCGLVSLEVGDPFVLGSGAPIVVTRVNNSSMDLSCALDIDVSGWFLQGGVLWSASGGPGWYGTMLANSKRTVEWNPETLFNDDTPLSTQFVVGNTYTVDACTFSFGPVGGSDGYMVDEDESNRCGESLSFQVVAP